jgi:hypothetical protein
MKHNFFITTVFIFYASIIVVLTKAAIIAGAGSLAAYFLLIRPRFKANEHSLIDETNTANFNRLPLKAHGFLAGIPLHSLDCIELHGGRANMTIADIYRVSGLSEVGEVEIGATTKALFDLRGQIGKVLGWDDVPELVEKVSYLPRLTTEERAKSLLPPGEVRGIARVLYCFENELLLEIINRTVHCFWCLASEKTADGYRLYNAVYVKKLNWRTPIYMTLVSPVLKLVIYPAIEKSVRLHWEREFPQKTKSVAQTA